MNPDVVPRREPGGSSLITSQEVISNKTPQNTHQKNHHRLPPHHLTLAEPIYVRRHNHQGTIVGTAFPCISWHKQLSTKLNIKISKDTYTILIPRALLNDWARQAQERFPDVRLQKYKKYTWQVRKA